MIKQIDEKVNLQQVHSEVNQQLKSVLHTPKDSEILKDITDSVVPFEELTEMVKKDEFLKEYILNTDKMRSFTLECDTITDQALDTAKQNTVLIETVS